MAIPQEITLLIERLYQELDETEQAAIAGLNLADKNYPYFPKMKY